MYRSIILSSGALMLLGACVSADEEVDSSSGEYIPEGYDPEAGPAEPDDDPTDDSYVPERSDEGPRL
ncbi:hypothetical protein [Sphingorhabdus sp. Alg231-15]|uniref:hypothetical protein n=1 Tax=Sphingorhabdus sp. Alg231-15 TaxID=1922222 RepID=UPI00307B7C66